jgi:Ca2+-binding RTX toxin-like protein
MSYRDIAKATNIDEAFSKSDRNAILGVIKEAYRQSSIARDMFDHWVMDKGREINFIYHKNDFSAWNGKVWLDMDELDNASYIDKSGNAVQDYPFTAIIHELGHALTGRLDNWTSAEPAGDNQLFANKIYKQAGYTEQLAYMAYDASGDVIQRGIDYTDGARIDSAWVKKWDDLPNNYDTTHNGKFTRAYDDLVIGSADDNRLETGRGDDFIYGLAGDDELIGGAGSDRLNGGDGADLLDGGAGLDYASYKIASGAVIADLADSSRNTASAAGDTFVSIEGLIGSDYADELSGNGEDNMIEGRDGDDTLIGYGGDDTLDGGDGANDRAIYSYDYDTYVFNRAAGTISGSEEGLDHLTDVEFAVFADGVLDIGTGVFQPDNGARVPDADYAA